MTAQYQHEIILVRILKEIYENKILRTSLGLKGDSADYFFYDKARPSLNLDFDLLNQKDQAEILREIKSIFGRFGKVTTTNDGLRSILFQIAFKNDSQKVKVEILKGVTKDRFEPKNYLGIPMLVMKIC